jgi:predicted DNA-binding transcriptional regulator
MSEEKIYTMVELVDHYRKGTLPTDVLVFKYLSAKGEGLIHRDEIQRESVISGLYATMHQDRVIGARTAPDQMSGVDKTNWEKNKRK